MSEGTEEVPIGETSTSAAATEARLSGVAGRDYDTDEGSPSGKADTGGETETSDDDADGPGGPGEATVGARLAGWWEARAKPGLRAMGDGITRGVKDSGRRFTVMRQRLKEQLGQTTKTIDVDLQPKIDSLKTLKHEYQQLADAARILSGSIAAASHAQISFGEVLVKLSDHEPELQHTYSTQAKFHDVLGKNLNALVEAVQFFRNQVHALATERAAQVAKQVAFYESVRVEYDAFRVEYEKAKAMQSPKADNAEERFLASFSKLQQTRSVTLQMLDTFSQEKLELMKQQFQGLLNAFSLFISGNDSAYRNCVQSLNAGDVESKTP